LLETKALRRGCRRSAPRRRAGIHDIGEGRGTGVERFVDRGGGSDQYQRRLRAVPSASVIADVRASTTVVNASAPLLSRSVMAEVRPSIRSAKAVVRLSMVSVNAVVR
jgi:hypothetical protein